MRRHTRPAVHQLPTFALAITCLFSTSGWLVAQDADPPADDPPVADPAAPTPAPPEAAPEDTGPRGPEIPGYVPPATPHPFLAIEKELVDSADLLEYKRFKPAFTKAMNDGSLVGENREIVEKGLKVLVLQMSLKENRKSLAVRRGEVERWIRNAAMQRSVKPNARRSFRTFVLERVIKHCRELLKGNLEVRLQTMLLLNRAVIMPIDPFKKTPEEFYVPTYKLFLEVLKDHEQHEIVRVWAAKGLRRVLDRGLELRNQDRFTIGTALMEELVPGHNGDWLDMRIAETAGDVGIVRFGGGKPVVVEGLCKVLNDRTRSCLVRSEAAKQLGRLPHDPNSNLSLFAQQTAQLVHEMSLKQAQNPQSARWRVCFLNAYLAFVPENRAELNAKEAGFLVRARKPPKTHEQTVQDALNQVAPLLGHVIGTNWRRPVPAGPVQQLDTWLKSNPPKDWRPTPDLEPLEVKRVAETPPTTTPAG